MQAIISLYSASDVFHERVQVWIIISYLYHTAQ